MSQYSKDEVLYRLEQAEDARDLDRWNYWFSELKKLDDDSQLMSAPIVGSFGGF